LSQEGDDETIHFLQSVAAEEMRLRCLTVIEPGQVAALNRGLEEARGDIVAFLDDDAAPHPNWLARIRDHFEADRSVGGVDRRLRGLGAQFHNDLGFCLEVRRRGWRLVYDPGVSVDHFLGGRHNYDQRNAFSALAVADDLGNAGLPAATAQACLHDMGGGRRHASATRRTAIRKAPARLGGPTAGALTAASLRGRWEGWQTWRRSRPFRSA
jgi:glycosyltransferase involved in cell wall biosynthesis